MKYGPPQKMILVFDFCKPMFLDVRCLVLMLLFRMGRKYPSGILAHGSDVHSSQVPMVLNVVTGKISTQFHDTFDDKFEMVHSVPVDRPLEEQCAQIF